MPAPKSKPVPKPELAAKPDAAKPQAAPTPPPPATPTNAAATTAPIVATSANSAGSNTSAADYCVSQGGRVITRLIQISAACLEQFERVARVLDEALAEIKPRHQFEVLKALRGHADSQIEGRMLSVLREMADFSDAEPDAAQVARLCRLAREVATACVF